MDGFVDLVSDKPCMVYVLVLADKLLVYAKTTKGTFSLCTEHILDSSICIKSPFVNSKYGYFRIEDGDLVSYNKKTLIRTVWRQDVERIYAAYDNKLLVCTKETRVAVVNIKNGAVVGLVEQPFITNPVEKAFFVNTGYNIVVLSNGSIKYYNMKALLCTITLPGRLIVNIAGDKRHEDFLVASIANRASYITTRRVEITKCIIDTNTPNKYSFESDVMIANSLSGLLVMDDQILCYDTLTQFWMYMCGNPFAKPSLFIPTRGGVTVAKNAAGEYILEQYEYPVE